MKRTSFLLVAASVTGCAAVDNFVKDWNDDPRDFSSMAKTQVPAYRQAPAYSATSSSTRSSSPSSQGATVGSKGKGSTCQDGSPALMAYDPATKGYTQPVCRFKGAK